jgi:hypothetical protein
MASPLRLFCGEMRLILVVGVLLCTTIGLVVFVVLTVSAEVLALYEKQNKARFRWF